MSILPRRFERIKSVLDCRMKNLTVLVEDVNKPHNLSAILRTCDAEEFSKQILLAKRMPLRLLIVLLKEVKNG